VVDAIRNATGGEGVWNPTFVPSRSHVLFAGFDPVATDAVGAKVMGLDGEATKLNLPTTSPYGDTQCDNYLALMSANGHGTNKLSEIQVLGDAHVLDVPPQPRVQQPSGFRLCANYPNPFNPSTMIVVYMERAARATVRVFDITGRLVETLIQGEVPAGEHRLHWSAQGLASGVYICRLETEGISQSIKMIYQR
jgi:hypothetical protein